MKVPVLFISCCSAAKSCPTLCDPMDYSKSGFFVLQYLPEFALTHAIESVMPSNHVILCYPLLLLPSVFPSIRVFSNKSALHIRRPKYWSFNLSISPSNEYSGLISFRIDWFDLLAVKELSRVFSSITIWKQSILQCSAFFMVQISCPYITTGKTIALTIQTSFSKALCFLICCVGLS